LYLSCANVELYIEKTDVPFHKKYRRPKICNEPFYSGIFSDEMADSVPACPTIETSLAVGSGQTARFAAWHKD
jgi:hypothetical protein